MTGCVSQAMAHAVEKLAAANVEDPVGDSWRLLMHAAGFEPGSTGPHPSQVLEIDQLGRFNRFIGERSRHRPVSQIIGWRNFLGHGFIVDEHVLDPRPETEIVVSEAVRYQPGRILDLGTGSGCILLSMLLALPAATGIAADCRAAALAIARLNCKRLGLAGRARMIQSDWFSNIDGIFDMIVANPPYVCERDYRNLQPDVRDWEPRNAVLAGPDGIEAYQAIAAAAPRHIRSGGHLVVEIDPAQRSSVTAIFADSFRMQRVVKDLEGRDRCIVFASCMD